MIKLNDLKVSVDYTSEEIKKAAAGKLKINPADIKSFDIIRRSVDARYNNVRFSLAVLVQANAIDEKLANQSNQNISKLNNLESHLKSRPVIVGAGPAGMFAALILAEAGAQPILIERGQPIEKRRADIQEFQKTGKLNTESNVCFGEGGAGTFSDGKLVTRVNDEMCGYVLNTFVKFGASSDILIDSRPHVGTDVLSEILVKIRKHIIALGAEVSFGEKMTDIKAAEGMIKSVITNIREIPCENMILAAGHGARDVYELLAKKSIPLEAKGFALGVRIEHPREMIDKAVYGKYAGHERLGAASYNLRGKFGSRSVFSFCMCPGGEVINSSTEAQSLCVNGMSYNARDGVNSNAAVVVQVNPDDWDRSALGGIELQRELEKRSYILAGSDFSAPVQRFADFKKSVVSQSFGSVRPSIKGKTAMADLNKILGDEISSDIKQAVEYWDKIITGYSKGDAVLTGTESRTSSPVRVLREKNMQSPEIGGLYPCGEGAGYAGGIMSAAIDGIKCALQILDSK